MRTSPKYLRVYDKGVEQGTHPPGIRWRIELEAKQETARGLWNRLRDTKNGPAVSYASCEASVTSLGCWWPLPGSSHASPLPAAEPPEPGDVARARKWLATQVRPTVQRLLPQLGRGELLELLGLDVDPETGEVLA